MLRTIAAAGFLMCVPAAALAAPQTYSFDPMHTVVVWQANHLGFSNPSGKFTKVEGTLILDETKIEDSKVSVNIDPASLVTGLEKFDEHLKSKDFLDVEQFPHARFESERVTRIGKNKAKIDGQLELHGVTKPVSLNVTLNKIGESMMTKKKTAGFTATTVIKRSQFGINFGLPAVSDDIKIEIQAEAQLADQQ